MKYPDRSPDFEDRVPESKRSGPEIVDWLKDNTGDSVGDKFAEGLADDIAQMREEEGGPVGAEGEGPGDVYFDPDAGQWRDSETGQFTKGP
jgi:hypothetical protein